MKKRVHKEELLGPSMDIDPLTDRLCRKCHKRLPKSRYFKHSSCSHYSDESAWDGGEYGYKCNRVTRTEVEVHPSDWPMMVSV